jgi:VanZ family protein
MISGSTNKRWIVWGTYTLLIAVASLAPSSSFKEAPSFSHADKIVHFLMYGLNAMLLLWALTPKLKNIALRLITTILFCSAYGILMEILQETLLPNDRTFSFWDIAANITGATCMSLIIIKRIKPKRNTL